MKNMMLWGGAPFQINTYFMTYGLEIKLKSYMKIFTGQLEPIKKNSIKNLKKISF